MTTPLRDQVQQLEAEVASLKADLLAAAGRVKHAEEERRRSAVFADTCEALGKKFAMACDAANARVKNLEALNGDLQSTCEKLEAENAQLRAAAHGPSLVLKIESVRIRIALDPREAPR